MHSQEPWQSRSPTGNVYKPSISSTLRKTGRKGPNHSYGRGLPVKRKALVILTVAILAFAMIPALGAGAAAGSVKIVTPDELANPSGTTGSAYSRLAGADFVSDSTGRDTLEDAGGTLYFVIEDNDPASNALTDYHAYYTAKPGTDVDGGNIFYINPLRPSDQQEANSVVAAVVTEANGDLVGGAAVQGDDGSTAAPTDATNTEHAEEVSDLNALAVGDDDRSGAIDGDDLTIELGWYVPPRRDDPTTTNADETAPALFTRVRGIRADNAFLDLFEADGDAVGIYLDNNDIPPLPTTPPANFPGTADGENRAAAAVIRITFASAVAGDLNYPGDHTTVSLQGESRVEITSTSGKSIRVEATEKSLAALSAESIGAAVEHDDIAGDANSSRDSGVFVGSFGVIDNKYKEAITEWNPAPVDTDQSQEITVIAAGGTPTDNSEVVPADAITTADDPNIDKAITRITLPGVDTENVLKTNSTETRDDDVRVTIKDPERNNDPTADPVEPDVAENNVDDDIIVDSVVVGAPDATTGEIVITVTTATGPSTDTTTGATLENDIFVLSYTTTALNNNISDLISSIEAVEVVNSEVTGATGQSMPFETFCDTNAEAGEECAEQTKLFEAIGAHRDNLGLTNDSDVEELANKLIGVQHGDTLTVRYSDPSPRSTRSASAEVDLVAPSIGNTSLANGAYVNDDDFSLFFTVTDADSGIPEDAHDAGEQTIRNALPFVSQASAGTATGDPADLPEHLAADQYNFIGGDANADESVLDVDDEIDDGERYEIEFDLTDTVQAAEGDENTDAKTVTIRVRILAYDLARNEASRTLTFIIDDLDPVLLRALTGVSVKAAEDANDPYELNDQNRKSIVLVFDDAIAGSDVSPQDVSVVGNSVASVTWLDNTGANKIGTAGSADSEIRDDLDISGASADARHLLFLTLENDLDTDARPSIDIDNGDLLDLAGNESNRDHQARSVDELAPLFTVTVGTPLSNNELSITIESSEDLERAPSARLQLGTTNEVLPVRGGSGNVWTVDTNRRAENLGGANRSGVYTVRVEGTDTNNNDGSSTKAEWELDTLIADPARVYDTDAVAAAAQPIEVNDVVFLNFEFSGEANEYGAGRGDDSAKTVSVTSLTLETLSADSLDSSNNLKSPASAVTVVDTITVGEGAAQTSNSIRYVVALSDLAIGNYRLNIDYADQAGNSDTFGYVFRITAPAPEKITVVPGWSLVSIPGTPQDLSIGGVLEGSAVTDVWSLNNETKVWEFARQDENGEWMGTLTQMSDGRAYFVRSTTFDPISVLTERFSPQRTPAQYTVTAGWNGIGYTPAGTENAISVDGYLSALGASGWGMIRAWNADATPPQYETYFSSGAMTAGFPTGDGPDGDGEGDNPDGTDGDNVADGVAKVEAGKGYLLFATRNGTIGG